MRNAHGKAGTNPLEGCKLKSMIDLDDHFQDLTSSGM